MISVDKWIEKTTKGYKNIYDVRKEQLNGTFNAKKEKDIAVHKIIYWRQISYLRGNPPRPRFGCLWTCFHHFRCR